MFKCNNKDASMTPVASGVFIVNFEQLLHLALLLSHFEQVNAGCERHDLLEMCLRNFSKKNGIVWTSVIIYFSYKTALLQCLNVSLWKLGQAYKIRIHCHENLQKSLIVCKKITTFFKQRVSIILWSFSS